MVSEVELYPNERMTPWGIERYCPRCKEWWPVEQEPEDEYKFWPKGLNSRNLYSYCTACNREIRNSRYHNEHPGAKYNKKNETI